MLQPLAMTLSIALAVPLIHPPTAHAASVKVVATLPILKEFAEQVGREHVEVHSLITGLESEHSYSPKPSDLRSLGEAHLLLEVGLGLEVWVGGLVKNAANPQLRVITTSQGVGLIRDHTVAAGSSASGNPHIWLDPENAKVMVRHIADGLIAVNPEHKQDYLNNLANYLRRLDQAQQTLQERVAGLQNRRIITHHPAWPYFARRFGFQIAGEIIQQAGMEPTAAHLAALARLIKADKIKVIVSEPQLNQKIVETLAGETGARVVALSPLPRTIQGTDSYLSLLEYNVSQLIAALQSYAATHGASPSGAYPSPSRRPRARQTPDPVRPRVVPVPARPGARRHHAGNRGRRVRRRHWPERARQDHPAARHPGIDAADHRVPPDLRLRLPEPAALSPRPDRLPPAEARRGPVLSDHRARGRADGTRRRDRPMEATREGGP